MDFEADIRECVLGLVPCASKSRNEFASKSTKELLVIYANWVGRLISREPRDVHISAALAKNPLIEGGDLKPAFDEIVRRFGAGDDLEPYLSERIGHGFQKAGTGAKRLLRQKNLDLLLNDWGVHHLHLSNRPWKEGFNERTGPLLFAAVQQSCAYLINIFDHGAWASREIAETVIRQWPDSGIFVELVGILPGEEFSDSERHQLRGVGLPTHVQVDGKVYISPRAMSTAGTSMTHALEAARIAAMAKEWEDNIGASMDFFLRAQRCALGQDLSADPDFHFTLGKNGCGIVERQTGFAIAL